MHELTKFHLVVKSFKHLKSMLTIGTLQQMKANIGMAIAGANQLQVSAIKAKSIKAKSDE